MNLYQFLDDEKYIITSSNTPWITIRSHIVCADGTSISVQLGKGMMGSYYLPTSPYEEYYAEVGLFLKPFDTIQEIFEPFLEFDNRNELKLNEETVVVFSEVPATCIQRFIDYHKGIDQAATNSKNRKAIRI